MINLIMCIGFSVDFSAHVSYHFMSRQNRTSPERVRDSMYALGLPIIQGACSTVIGVIGLAMAPSYIFITFFKMVFLVIVLGALHGLILLPVLLSLFGPGTCDKTSRLDSKKSAPAVVSSCENQNIDNAVVAAANAIAITVAPQSNGKIPHHHGDGNNHNHSNGASNGGGKKHHKHQNGVAKYVQSPIYEIKIPRPKHGPANGSAGSYSNSYSQSNGGSRASSRPR